MSATQDKSAAPADTENEDVTSSAATSTAEDENRDSSPEAREHSQESFGDAIAKAMNEESPEGESETDGDGEDSTEQSSDQDGEKTQQTESEETDSEGERGEAETEDDGEDLQEGQRVPYDRFKKVIDQRNQYREREQELTRERDEFRTGHEQFGAIQSFMQENELRPQDVAEALQIAAQMNSDPAGALEALKGKMAGLQEFTGERLPQDVQARVDSGEIDERDAQALVRQRNENALLQRRSQEAEQRRQQESEAAQTQQVQQAMASAANAAQQELAKGDPDFDRKYPWIEKELRLLIAQEQPRNADQAAQLVRTAHSNVTRDLEKLAPRRQVRPGPSSSQTASRGQSRNEPDSMAQAIQWAMETPTE